MGSRDDDGGPAHRLPTRALRTGQEREVEAILVRKLSIHIPVWLIVAAGVIGTVAVVFWISTIYDSRGHALLDAPTATVVVAILGLLSTLVGVVLKRTGEVKHQVANDHKNPDGTPKLMRNENDEHHAEQLQAIRGVADTVQSMSLVQRTLVQRVDRLSSEVEKLGNEDLYMRKRHDLLADTVHDLEMTVPKRRYHHDDDARHQHNHDRGPTPGDRDDEGPPGH